MPIRQVYPLVKSVLYPGCLGVAPWGLGDPCGITIHYTADRNLQRVVEDGRQSKIGYHLLIDRDGSVHQTAYLDQRVNHAGNAAWAGRSPNRSHIAVALLGWGKVNQGPGATYYSWTGAVVPPGDVRYTAGNTSRAPDFWDCFTAEQESKLEELCRYFIATSSVAPQDICGHDECAIPLGRKVDPGGSLSMPMPDFRRKLGA